MEGVRQELFPVPASPRRRIGGRQRASEACSSRRLTSSRMTTMPGLSPISSGKKSITRILDRRVRFTSNFEAQAARGQRLSGRCPVALVMASTARRMCLRSTAADRAGSRSSAEPQRLARRSVKCSGVPASLHAVRRVVLSEAEVARNAGAQDPIRSRWRFVAIIPGSTRQRMPDTTAPEYTRNSVWILDGVGAGRAAEEFLSVYLFGRR
jgi:hypothetical protein